MTSRTTRPSRAQMRRVVDEITAPEPPPPPLTAEVADLLDGFEPRQIDSATWATIQPFTVDVLARFQPKGLESARQRLTALVSYGAWAVDRGYGIDKATLLDHELIDVYATEVDVSPSTAANYRSRLRGMTNKVHPAGRGSRATVAVAHRSVKAPYDAREQQALVRIASTQPNATTGRQMRFCVGVGLGAGLDSTDIKYLRRRDITDHGSDGIEITVGGRRPRTVWVRRDHEQLVRSGLEGVRPDSPVIGKTAGTRNVCAPIYERAVIVSDDITFEQSRMRTSWLATLLLAKLPLPVIMTSAGLTSARTLTDIVPFLDVPGDADDLRGGAA